VAERSEVPSRGIHAVTAAYHLLASARTSTDPPARPSSDIAEFRACSLFARCALSVGAIS